MAIPRFAGEQDGAELSGHLTGVMSTHNEPERATFRQ